MGHQTAFVFLVGILGLGQAIQVLDLGGEWSLKSEDGKYSDLTATVPGGIYTDLQNNDIIGDIYWRYADNETRWVPRTNWTYSTKFTIDDKILSNDNIRIKFEGLDTFSSILINDVEIGQSRNMHMRYTFNIKDVLEAGENTIEVRFVSPIEVSAALGKAQLEGYIIPPECFPSEYQGECYVNQIRKMQASFSWDWGPSFPSVGIWKNVTIEAYNESVIDYVTFEVADFSSDNWLIDVDVYFANNSKGAVQGLLKVLANTDGTPVEFQQQINVTENGSNELVFNAQIQVEKDQVQLWWPNGFGKQPLYDLNVTFESIDSSEKQSVLNRVGYRTIELVQDTIAVSLSFYFKVNGYPIFMKGSNVVPLDILPEKGYLPEIIDKTFDNAIAAHMNMLRIWGGGLYESELFYDTADERGLLIWQDYMFASAYYPVHDEFLENVAEEVRHQTKRLRKHACLAVIAGNNENEGNVRGNSGWYNQGNHTQYIEDYIKLTDHVTKPEVLRITKNMTIFIGSSPTNGKKSDEEGGVADNPGDTKFGDIHSYLYGSDHFETTSYPVARFISEYGLQSYPSMDSLRKITDQEEDFHIHSAFMENRNHHPSGNNQINDMVARQFKLPDEDSDNYFNAIVYYSQVVVGWGIKIETEHFRRYRSFYTKDFDGMTMGALYWQMNDVWIAPSWAGVDYSGKWKVLQYKAIDFFAPIIVTGHIYDERRLEVFGVSDLLEDTTKANFTLEVYKWTDFNPVETVQEEVTLEPSASQLIYETQTDRFLSRFCGSEDEAKTKCFIRLALTDERGDNIAPENFVFPAHFKDLDLETPVLKIQDVVQVDDTHFKIGLTTDKIAAFVWLDSHEINGIFSENAFTMYTKSKTVTFTSELPTDLQSLYKILTVTNLRNEEFL